MGLRGYIYGHAKAGKVFYTGENKINFPNQFASSFKPDGTRMYLTIHNGDYIQQYNLTTPWNITTAVSAGQSLFITQEGETVPHGHFISPDGLKMFICGTSSNKILQYSLSTAWDVTTASYVGFYSPGYSPLKVKFSSDGLLMFIWEGTNLRKYSLSTVWDISTATLQQTKNVIAANTFHITNEGLCLFVFASTPRVLYKYYLQSPFDISTFVKTETVDLSSVIPLGNFEDINFKPDGLKMFISLYFTSVYAFDLEKPFNIKGGLIAGSEDTTADGKQAFLVIGDSTSAGNNNNGGNGTSPAAGTAYYYKRNTNTVVAMTSDVIAAPAGTQYPNFCTAYYNGSSKKAVIIPTGVGGSNFASEGGGDTNDWSTVGANYALAKTDALNTLSILGLTKLKMIFITSLGINDARGTVPLATIQDAISGATNGLITRLQADFPGVPILIEQIGRDEFATADARTLAVRGYLRAVCENNAGCHMINGMLSLYGAGLAGADNVHPSQAGNNIRGEMYARWMLNTGYSKWSRSIISSHFDELSTTRKSLIANFIDNNLTDFLQHDSLLMFKTTTVNNIFFDWGYITSPVSSGVTFTANDSISTNGSSTYYRTNTIKSRSYKATQNDSFDAIKIKINSTGTGAPTLSALGGLDATPSAVSIQQTSTGVGYRHNDNTTTVYTTDLVIANNTEYLTGRSDSTTKKLYKNGTEVNSATVASTGNCGQQTYIGANNNTGTAGGFIALSLEYSRSGKFTTVNQSSFKSALDTFLSAW